MPSGVRSESASAAAAMVEGSAAPAMQGEFVKSHPQSLVVRHLHD